MLWHTVLLSGIADAKLIFEGRYSFLNPLSSGTQYGVIVEIIGDGVSVRVTDYTNWPVKTQANQYILIRLSEYFANKLPIIFECPWIGRNIFTIKSAREASSSINYNKVEHYHLFNSYNSGSDNGIFRSLCSAPEHITYGIDGVSGAVALDVVDLFKNPLSLNACLDGKSARLGTRHRVVASPQKEIKSTMSLDCILLGRVTTIMGPLRVSYVFARPASKDEKEGGWVEQPL